MIDINKRTWAEISINAVSYNLYKTRNMLPEGCKIMGVVKSNAYGHGAVGVSKILQNSGCDYLAVACLEEAQELRNAGIKLPVLILGYTPAKFIERVVDCGAIQSLISPEAAMEYSEELRKLGKTLKIHVKLETGMGRTGFNVKSGDVGGIVRALALPGFEAEGIFTHFAVADNPSGDDYTRTQFKLFVEAIEKIEKATGISFPLKHCANSAAIISYPEMYMNMVRPGLALYGCYPSEEHGDSKLAPVMELKTRIVEVFELEAGESIGYGCTFTADRKMTIAVLPIGYGDGLHRNLSGKMDVIIHDKRCPQVGRICMDMCMADVTGCSGVKTGEVAVIFGHDCDEIIRVEEQAEKAGTISYELLCSVSSRVPRFYCK